MYLRWRDTTGETFRLFEDTDVLALGRCWGDMEGGATRVEFGNRHGSIKRAKKCS